jgi:hypothetical protein
MVNKTTLGLTLGSFAALVHVVWALLVATGTAQAVMNWVHKIHFLSMPTQIMPFDIGTALLLVVVAFVMGNVVGMVLATLWNSFHGKK